MHLYSIDGTGADNVWIVVAKCLILPLLCGLVQLCHRGRCFSGCCIAGCVSAPTTAGMRCQESLHRRKLLCSI